MWDINSSNDESLEDQDNLPAPAIIAREIGDELQAALDQFAEVAANPGNTIAQGE